MSMDLKDVVKHVGICTIVAAAASICTDKYVDKSSMSSDNKKAVKTTITGAALGIPVGYFLGEFANKGRKDYTAKEKIVSSAAGGLCLGAAGYWISRVVEYNGKKMAASASASAASPKGDGSGGGNGVGGSTQL